jgi:excisionase family DNA binding protein
MIGDPLLSAKELSQYLGRSLSTVYRLAENEEIPFIKGRGVGLRFRRGDIDKWLEDSSRKSRGLGKQFQWLDLNISHSDIIKQLGGERGMPKGKAKTRFNFGYGAIYQRKTRKGNIRWYLDYRDAKGERVQKVAALARTKEEAVLALQEELKKAFNGLYGIKNEKPKISFKEFVDMFIENYSKTNKRSWKDDKCRLSGLVEFFGDVALQDVSPLDIEKFKSASISRGLAKSTVNRYLAILKRMFNIAISWGKAKDNPMKQVRLYPEADNLKERILSPNEETRLLANSPKHLAPILVAALNTGMRRGEILCLTWGQIDFKAKEITIQRTKSGKPRVVDINSHLLDTLLRLKRQDGNAQYVFLNPKTGRPYGKLQNSFETACRKSGIKNLRFHDLRHTFASRLIERGADIIRVKELLGHSTVRVTERYLHSNRDERKRVVELLCQKPPENSKIPPPLLRIRDTEKAAGPNSLVFHLFSVN